MNKNIALVIALLVSLSAMAACTNTVDGAGKDIERAGENIQETVNN